MLPVFAEAFYQAPEPMLITDGDSLMMYANQAFTGLTGYSEAEIQGRHARMLRSGRHDGLFYRVLWKELLMVGAWSGEVWNRRKDGEIYVQWLSISALRDAEGTVTHYVAVMNDSGYTRSEEQRLASLANHDPLTGLPNRALFVNRLGGLCARAQRNQEEAALLFVDLDHFKRVTEMYSTDAADEVLRQVTERLCQSVRDSDAVARLGGDEFAVTLSALTRQKDVSWVADKILAALNQPYVLASGDSAVLSASIGIVSIPHDTSTADQALKFGELAMYKAKEDGRNRYSFYSAEIDRAILARTALIREVRTDLAAGRLLVHYQPILDTHTNRVVGAEALLRWQRSSGELASAASFIEEAEDSGLIIQIGDLVLDRVIDDLTRWSEAGFVSVRVAINLSRRQLCNPESFSRLRIRMRKAGLPIDCLEFEISEAILSDTTLTVQESLQKLGGFGVGLVINNFGTGYTSLQQLRKAPVAALKIDKLVIRDLLREGENAVLTDTIIGMAHALGLRIVAEGVETDAQRESLRQRSCDFVQGNQVSEPLSGADFLALLMKG